MEGWLLAMAGRGGTVRGRTGCIDMISGELRGCRHWHGRGTLRSLTNVNVSFKTVVLHLEQLQLKRASNKPSEVVASWAHTYGQPGMARPVFGVPADMPMRLGRSSCMQEAGAADVHACHVVPPLGQVHVPSQHRWHLYPSHVLLCVCIWALL